MRISILIRIKVVKDNIKFTTGLYILLGRYKNLIYSSPLFS